MGNISNIYFPGLETAPRRLHPYFGDFVGMASSALSTSQEKPSPSRWGESREEPYLIGCKTENSLSLRSSVKLVYPALWCGCVGVKESTGFCLESPSLIPVAAGCSLCPVPPALSSCMLSTVLAALMLSASAREGKAAPQTRCLKEKFEKGNYCFTVFPPFT